MLDLTPAERRGALVLISLVLLGTAWDLLHLEPHMAPAVPASAYGPGGAPTAPEAPAGPDAGPAVPPPGGPVDVNAASATQLDALPGIGPVLAARIVERRAVLGRFANPEELLSVRGIGPRLYERLRPRVTCGVAGRTGASDSLQLAR